MTDLTQKKCVPCEGGVPKLTEEESQKFLEQTPDWQLADDKISKEFELSSFKESIAFVNKVADLAESEGHHPNIEINFKKVKFVISTHAIGGLSENDFILAAKIDKLS